MSSLHFHHRPLKTPSTPTATPIPPFSSSAPFPGAGFRGRHPSRGVRHRLQIRAIDAAQPYDPASRLPSTTPPSASKLKIAIVGFGNFGQFLARTFSRQGHSILAHSRSDYSDAAASIGASFFSDPHDLCEEHPDVVLLSTSILSTKSVVESFPFHRLRRSTLLVDVLSVKEFPRNLLLQILPPEFDVLCTHPMFGPESGKNGWEGLSFVYDKVRIGDTKQRNERCERFLDIFENEGCKMVEMSCADHDKHAAWSQFITHTVGRVLARLGLEETPVRTMGYETLLKLVDNTSEDSFDLYYGLFMYNKNSTELLENFEVAFDDVKKELFAKLHDIVRKQLFDSIPLDKCS